MSFDWRTATDAEVDLQYSPSKFGLQPLDAYLREYHELSAPWAGKDLVTPGAPLLVYIHGGYWQRLSAADSLFNAPDAARLGFSLHATEYTLAPHATVEQIVQECIDDVVGVLDRADAPRVVVAGCSAGAHLATMVALSPRLEGRIGMVTLLSGIYDLRPVVRIEDNGALRLDETRAAALSPALLPHTTYSPRAVVAVRTIIIRATATRSSRASASKTTVPSIRLRNSGSRRRLTSPSMAARVAPLFDATVAPRASTCDPVTKPRRPARASSVP